MMRHVTSRPKKRKNVKKDKKDKKDKTIEIVHESADYQSTKLQEFESARAAFDKILSELPAFQKRAGKRCIAIFDLDDTILKHNRTFPNIRSMIEELRKRGVEIVLLTARRSGGRAETIETLKRLGIVGHLVMKPDNSEEKSSIVKAAQRKMIAKAAGCKIFISVGDQISDILPNSKWQVLSETFAKLPEKSAVGRTVRASRMAVGENPHDHLRHVFGTFEKPFIIFGGEKGNVIENVYMSLKLPNIRHFTK